MKLHRSLSQIGHRMEDVARPGERRKRILMRNVAWLSAGVTAVALGLVVGREVRQRYKFSRRTPYDFYAHSGDQVQDVEFGVGI